MYLKDFFVKVFFAILINLMHPLLNESVILFEKKILLTPNVWTVSKESLCLHTWKIIEWN